MTDDADNAAPMPGVQIGAPMRAKQDDPRPAPDPAPEWPRRSALWPIVDRLRPVADVRDLDDAAATHLRSIIRDLEALARVEGQSFNTEALKVQRDAAIDDERRAAKRMQELQDKVGRLERMLEAAKDAPAEAYNGPHGELDRTKTENLELKTALAEMEAKADARYQEALEYKPFKLKWESVIDKIEFWQREPRLGLAQLLTESPRTGNEGVDAVTALAMEVMALRHVGEQAQPTLAASDEVIELRAQVARKDEDIATNAEIIDELRGKLADRDKTLSLVDTTLESNAKTLEEKCNKIGSLAATLEERDRTIETLKSQVKMANSAIGLTGGGKVRIGMATVADPVREVQNSVPGSTNRKGKLWRRGEELANLLMDEEHGVPGNAAMTANYLRTLEFLRSLLDNDG